ncbi:Glycosyl transferase (modular protein) [uncultured Pleomorphomonas sp.]|uniref:Glycosyl transferase (Modular protein) n=2 Tax=uncultured Pleomorphomonas sp. TaxID=442121 RepID=A0A212LAF0_9HYPH|nr:Glycosyl transferase (modular protein) [uncultured Pleomorphomonas sp.]
MLINRRPARWRDPDVIKTVLWLAGVLTVLAIVVSGRFDEEARAWVMAGGRPAPIWRFLSRLGQSDWMLIPSGVVLIVMYCLRRPRFGGPTKFETLHDMVLFFFAAIAATGIAVLVVKYSLGFSRPSVEGARVMRVFAFHPSYASFPSGHSTTAAAFALSLTLLWRPLAVVVWPLAIAIGASRVMVNAHRISDVVAGLSFGAWGTLFVATWFARRGRLFRLSESGLPLPLRHRFDTLSGEGRALLTRLRLVISRRTGVPDFHLSGVGQPDAAKNAHPAGVTSMIIPKPSETGFVSVVIPARNEADNLAVIVPEILAAMAGRAFEVIVVDDGSTDGTGAAIAAWKAEGKPVRHIRHVEACGQSAAVRSGVLAARGEIVATIDGDGQNDPAYIPRLIDALIAAGPSVGIAAGQRLKRTDGLAKRYASRFANWLRNVILKDATRDTGCGLKAVRRDIFLLLPFFHGWHRYLPALVLREGYGVTHLDVVDRSRMHGASNYGIFDRGLQGILDLFGVWWLKRRIKRLPVVSEIGGDNG